MTASQQVSTKEEILRYLLKQGQATAHELAEALSISPQATRRHLKDLETAELIEHQSIQVGMGRPQHKYSLSHQGKEHFPHRYGDFTVSFLDTLIETVGEEQVGAVFRKQWQRKAVEYRDRIGTGSLKERVETLIRIRQEEGYMAELHSVDANLGSDREEYIFAEHHCAISDVAESFPTVCDRELEMFEAILPDCTVERTHWINNGEHRCGYLVRAR
ncbi:MAG: iron-sulfur cluster biosynthesis transcriptional regulator SufR [Cyanobacteria bacterium SBLK]|nr:iron-sulfur cluster biosynthesis transcriptional regulator SufR [Cyanobacteria bacterium SBLK]